MGIGSGVLTLIDYVDNDGDLDAVVTKYGDIKYYENSGSISQPHFEERDGEQNPFVNVDKWRVPIFVDLDNDGDLDAFIDSSSVMKYYRNESNVNQPAFEPNIYALPKSGIYNYSRQISLNCLDKCEKIYYTLDGTIEAASAIEYTAF
jgi:hypothetical protein